MKIVNVIITPEREDFTPMIEWIEQYCPSFDKYQLVELSDVDRDKNPLSWFELKLHFNDEQDATLFALRWM